MPSLRIVLLWHMHQPYYKDLLTGEYRLPWVRLHALKDYFGMVRLLEEFPGVHQNFNLVPSLLAQVQEYVSGEAHDPFLDVAAKPAAELSPAEKRLALKYLFQANVANQISRYPRLVELHRRFVACKSDPAEAEAEFDAEDFADLQVLSQLAWFDEYFLAEPDIRELVQKERGYTREDQAFVIRRQRELMARVLPAYVEASRRGAIEVSTTPYYHPILPLLCDSSIGAAASPGLTLPKERFRRPEDAAEQLRRAIEYHRGIFGAAPQGCWPSEGSVSEEVLRIGHNLGLNWMASDEGVLARTLGIEMRRESDGRLAADAARQLYRMWRYEADGAGMHLLFRDRTLSDLIGFTYATVPPAQAVEHFLQSIRRSAEPLLQQGITPVVPIILDGENAWDHFPGSGREFLRRLYAALENDSQFEALTISEAIERQRPEELGHLDRLAPGSWINANFNVWIGAPEDNRAWDYLAEARAAYDQFAPHAAPGLRDLAFEELLIAEGSDWNWWYGPEHHSDNDEEFDELYRRHLSNVYHALGTRAPEYLLRPLISRSSAPAIVSPQSAYISPRIEGDLVGYFEWLGAASYRPGLHGSSMHGKLFVLQSAHAGVDAEFFYGRLDFAGDAFLPQALGREFELVVSLEARAASGEPIGRPLRLEIQVAPENHQTFRIAGSRVISGVRPAVANPRSAQERGQGSPRGDSIAHAAGLRVRMGRIFEFRIALAALGASLGDGVALGFSVWRDRMPVDALPTEGEMVVPVISEEEMAAF